MFSQFQPERAHLLLDDAIELRCSTMEEGARWLSQALTSPFQKKLLFSILICAGNLLDLLTSRSLRFFKLHILVISSIIPPSYSSLAKGSPTNPATFFSCPPTSSCKSSYLRTIPVASRLRQPKVEVPRGNHGV